MDEDQHVLTHTVRPQLILFLVTQLTFCHVNAMAFLIDVVVAVMSRDVNSFTMRPAFFMIFPINNTRIRIGRGIGYLVLDFSCRSADLCSVGFNGARHALCGK